MCILHGSIYNYFPVEGKIWFLTLDSERFFFALLLETKLKTKLYIFVNQILFRFNAIEQGFWNKMYPNVCFVVISP